MLNSNIVQLSRRRFAATLAGSLGRRVWPLFLPGRSFLCFWSPSSKLLDHELIERQVLVERVDHSLAIVVDLARLVASAGIVVRITRLVHLPLVRVRARVGEKLVDFL